MVILHEVRLHSRDFGKDARVEALHEETAFIAEHLGIEE